MTVLDQYRKTDTVKMELSDTKIRSAKASVKDYKLPDGKSLYLLVKTNGGKLWRYDYAFNGKRKTYSIGVYPEVSLADARDRLEHARKLLANGVDPTEAKRAEKSARLSKAANSFEVVAREWFDKQKTVWVDSHANRIIRRLERDIFPWIGVKPIADLEAPLILQTIRRIEARGAGETAHRALQNLKSIFTYAIATGRATRNPASDIGGALAPVKGTHFAAATTPDEVAKILRAIDGYQGTATVMTALRIAPMVFVRPGELRKAKWSEINLESAEWCFTVSKTETPHIVPLSSQVVALLKELHPLTKFSQFVFPSARSFERPMSDNAILAAFRSMGIGKDEMTGHGWRAAGRTILDEVLHYPPHLIEHQLSHAVKDANGRAYNRTTHLPQRKEMMQAWSDYLDKLRKGADIISFPTQSNQIGA